MGDFKGLAGSMSAGLSPVVLLVPITTPAQLAADLQAVGANGLPKWQSYVRIKIAIDLD